MTEIRGVSVLRLAPAETAAHNVDWERRFAEDQAPGICPPTVADSDRHPEGFVPALDRPRDAVPLLRKRYLGQSQRARLLFTDPRLKQPGCAPLVRLAAGSGQVSRLLSAALGTPPAPSHGREESRIVSPNVLAEAIDWNERQLDRLENQLHFLDFVDALWPPLRTLVDQLKTSVRVSSIGWKHLVRHVVCHAIRTADAASALPLPGFSLNDYLGQPNSVLEGAVFARGIETACLLARLLFDHGAESSQLELLTVAALCQDCGLLMRQKQGIASPENSAIVRPEIVSLHPSIGAALVAGLSEWSADLPFLVAEHHRRLHDFTSPIDVSLPKSRSRVLAPCVRLLELIAELRGDSDIEVAEPQIAFRPAAVHLAGEANRGEWDAGVVAALINALGLKVDIVPLDAKRHRGRVFQNDDGEWRIDDADVLRPVSNILVRSRRRGLHVEAR